MNPDKSVLGNVTHSLHHVTPVVDTNSIEVKTSAAKAGEIYEKCDEFFDVDEGNEAEWDIAFLSQEEPEVRSGWFKRLSAVAVGTGSSLLQAVKTVTPQTVQNAASAAGAYVRFTAGELAGVVAYAQNGNFAVDMAQSAAGVLPDAGFYRDKISKSQQDLKAVTESDACSKMCTAAAAFVGKFLDFYLVRANEIETKELRIEAIDNYLFVTNPDMPNTFTTLGKVVSSVVGERMDLIQETVELNLLHICTNLIHALQRLQEDNPYILIDIVMLALDETGKEQQVQKNEKLPQNEELESELFCKNLSKLLIRYGLPGGASDLEIPFMSQTLSPFIYDLLENKLVPSLLSVACETAMSDKSRDLLFLKGCKMVQDYYKNSSSASEAIEVSKPLSTYSDQEKFNEKLGFVAYDFIQSIDPRLFAFLSLFGNPKKQIMEYGPQLAETLAQINLVSTLNTVVEAATELLDAPVSFIKTEEEKMASEKEEENEVFDRAEVISKVTDETVAVTETHLLQKMTPELPSQVLKHVQLLRKAIKNCFKTVLNFFGIGGKLKTATLQLPEQMQSKVNLHSILSYKGRVKEIKIEP